MTRRLVVVATLTAFVLPASATAALEVRLSVVPASPRVGARALVQIRPYWTYKRPDGSCCRLVAADTRYPFKVEAVSPSGRVSIIAVHRTHKGYVWAGSFVFRSRGAWTVRDPQWGPSYSPHYGARPRFRLTVR